MSHQKHHGETFKVINLPISQGANKIITLNIYFSSIKIIVQNANIIRGAAPSHVQPREQSAHPG